MKNENPIAQEELLSASDEIARNLIKKAILEETFAEKIASAIYKKNIEQIKIKIEKLTISGLVLVFFIGLILVSIYPLWEPLQSIGVTLMLSSFTVYLVIIFSLDKLIWKMTIRSFGSKKNIKENLEEKKETFPTAYHRVEQAFEVANEDGTFENFIPIFFTTFLTELLIDEKEVMRKEQLKRDVCSITQRSFILESLTLLQMIENESYITNLENILQAFKVMMINWETKEKHLKFFAKDFPAIEESIKNIQTIIKTLKNQKEDKTLGETLEKESQKLRRIVEKAPMPRSKITKIKSPKGMKKEETLTTISALDDEIIEIRTRAGNYYVSRKYFQHEISQERRMLELLTDKELEIKIEVLKSTLKILEEQREGLTEEEFETIKGDYLKQLFTTEELLAKRTGKSAKIICPYCQTENYPRQRTCKKCGKELPYCIICLNSLGVGAAISLCPHCHSLAHENHFRDWLEKTSICPYCKKKIKGKPETTTLEAVIDIVKQREE